MYEYLSFTINYLYSRFGIEILVFTFLFVLVLFIPQDILYRNKKKILLIFILIWLFSAGIHPYASNFNLGIYKYFADLALSKYNPYKYSITAAEEGNIPHRYLDYTGLQQKIYELLQYIDRFILKHPILHNRGIAFSEYQFIIIILIILLSYLRGRKSKELCYKNFIILSSFLTFNLFFHAAFSRGLFEDKAIFLLIPLLLLYLIERKFWLGASIILGLSIALNGIMIVFLPFYFILLWRLKNRKILIFSLITLFVAFLIGMIPYFPDSLIGWSRRMALERTPPTYFSIFAIFPDIYFDRLNYYIILIILFICFIFYLLNKLDIKKSLLICPTLLIVLSNYSAVQRMAPVYLLWILAFSKVPKLIYILIFIIILMITPLLNLNNSEIKFIHIIMLYLPLLIMLFAQLFIHISNIRKQNYD